MKGTILFVFLSNCRSRTCLLAYMIGALEYLDPAILHSFAISHLDNNLHFDLSYRSPLAHINLNLSPREKVLVMWLLSRPAYDGAKSPPS